MKSLLNPYFIGSIFIFIVHFFIANLTYSFYSIDRILIIFFLSFLLLYEFINNKRVISKREYKNIFVIFFIYAFFQTFFSQFIESKFEVLQQLYISMYFLLLILFFLTFKLKKYTLSSYLSFIILVNSVIILFLLLRFVFLGTTLVETINHYFINYRLLNHLQTLMIPSLGLALFLAKKESYRILITLLIVLNFLLLIDTGARGSSYAVLSGYLFLLFTNLRSKRVLSHILMMGFLYIFSFILYSMITLSFFNETVSSHLLSTSASGRLEIYNALLPYIVDTKHFFFALGFSPQGIENYHYLSPHNLFLYMFLGTGTFGLFIFCISFFYYLVKIGLEYFKSKNSIKKYLFVMLLPIVIHSMVSGIYLSPLSVLLVLYFLFIFSSYYCKKEENIKSLSKKFYGVSLSVMIAFTIGINYLSYSNYILTKKFLFPKNYEGNHLHAPGIMLYTILVFKDN